MKYLLPLAMIAILLPACYPSYGLSTEDYRTVVTVYDTAQNFAELRTYFLYDSVFHIGDNDGKDTISREYDEEILNYIAANFNSYGWQRVTDTTGAVAPSSLIKVSATSQTTWGQYWNYWYPWYPGGGGGWWGYPGWGWGGYYPPYWGGGGVYSYTTGSLMVELDEIILPEGQDSLEFEPVWLGSSNGLLSSSASSNVERIGFEIRQMFDQSPYLNLPIQP